jgi:hypothetical protein
MAKVANYKISIELEKLKIYVEGARDIAPEIANNVAQQIATVLQPAGLIEGPSDNGQPINVTHIAPAKRQGRRRSGATRSDPPNGGSVNWPHDPAKWGTPVQTWQQWKKIMWLLFVVEQALGNSSGLTADQVNDTFNTKFKDAGLIVKGNIKRDLSKQDENFGSVDGRWFLKQGGKTEAAKLVAEAKGERTA